MYSYFPHFDALVIEIRVQIISFLRMHMQTRPLEHYLYAVSRKLKKIVLLFNI